MRRLFLIAPIVVGCALSGLSAQTAPPAVTADDRAFVDKAAADALARTGVPGASVAIVQHGRVVFLGAYGQARLSPAQPAGVEMRYSRFLPTLTRANEVTIREVLSHTSGYQDYWPQDYLMPTMLRPTAPEHILDLFARKPLDFEPGTKWQYSNSNYVIAGLIVEKASGMPLLSFLHQHIFDPLGMKSVTDINDGRLAAADPEGYLRYALGPLRPAPKEAQGWLFAAGELAMTAEDLGRWDASITGQTILKPASYQALGTDTLLKNGLATGYGLGVQVETVADHRSLLHTGEVSGFTSANIVFPEDGAAVAVLTNEDASSAATLIAFAVAPSLVTLTDPQAPTKLDQAKRIFEGLQRGTIDRALFTDDANSYFTAEALQDFASSLGPLGTPDAFVQSSQTDRGGMIERVYRVRAGTRALRVWTYELPDGKLEQFQVAAG